jgi:hypothetical protein
VLLHSTLVQAAPHAPRHYCTSSSSLKRVQPCVLPAEEANSTPTCWCNPASPHPGCCEQYQHRLGINKTSNENAPQGAQHGSRPPQGMFCKPYWQPNPCNSSKMGLLVSTKPLQQDGTSSAARKQTAQPCHGRLLVVDNGNALTLQDWPMDCRRPAASAVVWPSTTDSILQN